MSGTLMTRNGPELAAAFSPLVMRALSRAVLPSQERERLRRVASTVVEDPKATLGEAFDAAHDLLFRWYRSEYVYKNSLVSKIVFGRHSPGTAAALLEVPMGSSCADLMIVNGTTTVYEIKTDLDQFSRLNAQLRDYSTRAERVVVVTSEKRAALALQRVSDNVGVIALRGNGALTVVREARSNLAHLDPSHLFAMLRSREVRDVLNRMLGWEAPTDQAAAWTEMKLLFEALDPAVAHREVVSVLRKRAGSFHKLVSDPGFPRSLRAMAYLEEHSIVGVDRIRYRLRSLASEFLGLAPA